MANFTTHIASGIIAGGVLSTLAMASAAVTPAEVISLTATCALGAVLPDVDLQKSRASQAFFSGLGIFIAFSILFKSAMALSLAEMWILWVGTYLVVRYVGHNLFHRYAMHRGVFHSILAALFFACVTAIVHSHVFGASDTLAWLAAAFMLVGYVLHLVLDEVYSVDVMNERVKASFGTALKLWDSHHPMGSIMMAGAVVAAFLVAPPAMRFVDIMARPSTWTALSDRLLPHGDWFNVHLARGPETRGGPIEAGEQVTAPAGEGAGAAAPQ
ncbi:MAG: metal-dependent hydrolase [Hyphomicrobiaceae bacterium]